MGPETRECGGCSGATLLRAVAQPHQPAAAVAQMIASLLHCLCCDRRQMLVRRRRQPLVHFQLKSIDEHLTRDRLAEVAVRLLSQGRVQIVAMLTQEGELILVAASAFDLSGI